jgi:hypothetical protein
MDVKPVRSADGESKSEMGVLSPPALLDDVDDLDRQIAAMSPEEYAKVEKKLKIKMDLQVVTLCGVFYLLSFLDRTNIASAHIMGLVDDLALTTHDFSVAVTVLVSFREQHKSAA